MGYPYVVIFRKDKQAAHHDFADLAVAQVFVEECKRANTFCGLCLIQGGEVKKIDIDEMLGNYVVDGYLSDSLPETYQINERNQEWGLSYKAVIQSYRLYSLVIATTILISTLANYYSPYRVWPVLAVCLAAFFYSASTLGYLVTWKIQSLPGETPPERFNARLLVIGYVLGTAFTIFSLDLG